MHNRIRVAYRRGLRIQVTFPARIHGPNGVDRRLKVDALVDNLSSRGLYVTVPAFLAPGSKAFVIVRLSSKPDLREPAPSIAIRGKVIRAESHAEGAWGIAISVERYRFL